MTESPLDHPTDDVLRALSVGQLPEAELVRVSAHLGDCIACCQRIDQLTTDDRLLTRLQQGATSEDVVLADLVQRRSAVRALRHSHEAKSTSPDRDRDAVPVMFPVPKEVGDYDILGEVGRGGMGVVYKVRHRGLQRLAALKMVLAGEFASRTQGVRFRLEAELAARVQHPNIVQVYEIGSHDGRPFLALEWVEGGSLAERLDGKPWPPSKAAFLIEILARAIQVAHSEGVVHRDLKPANILMTADDTPKITDFGLAQPLESSTSLTRTGFLVGTPGYMAPEQATGNRALLGPGTDIYALGVMLYQFSTGQLPFRGDNTLELLRAVTSDEPIRPCRLQPRLPRDLEAITLHCLEKEPSGRYPTALALAEDLRRFREGKQVEARPVGAMARLARTVRRHPLVTLLFVLLGISLVGGLGGVTWNWLEANEQRDLANANARQAYAEKQAALNQAYRASLAAACAALENHDVATAARHLESAPDALRGWEWRHLHSRLDDSVSVIPLFAEGGILISAPEGIRVGTWTSVGLRVTDAEGGGQVTVPVSQERRRIVSVIQTGSGLRIATWAGNGAIEVLDANGKVLRRVTTMGNTDLATMVLSPDGTRLACAPANNLTHIELIDVVSGQQTAICRGHTDTVWALAFSPDGTRLASGGEDGTVRLWETETGKPLATCRGHTSKVVSSAFGSNGTRLVSASSDGTVRQWDAGTGREVEAPYERHSGEVFSAVYSPDGQFVASTGADRTVRVWRAHGRQDQAVFLGHRARVAAVAFTPSGRHLVSLSCRSLWVNTGDDTARLWNVDSAVSLPALRGHTRAIHPLVYSPDGRWLASGSRDATVRLWDAATGEPIAKLQHLFFVSDLCFGPDGTWLMTVNSKDNCLRLWDKLTARVRKEIPTSANSLNSLTVSPDGTTVATSGNDPETNKKCLSVFDIKSGNLLYSTEGSSLTYSPDGRWLATLAADDTTVLLLDARTHEIARRFTGHEGAVCKVAFSPDGLHLASCSKDTTIRLWPIGGGECRVLRGHSDEVYAIAFHPDGTRLASGGLDGTVWLWDLIQGEVVVRLAGHKSFVWSLAFSPNGATLASGSGDATIRLWDTSPLKTRYRSRAEATALRPDIWGP